MLETAWAGVRLYFWDMLGWCRLGRAGWTHPALVVTGRAGAGRPGRACTAQRPIAAYSSL